MGRNHRIEYSGAIYHVIQRGNNKSYIFQDEEDKLQLLYLIEKYKEEMMYEILAFVIMDNHYHIIIKTLEQPIHKIMRLINTQFSKYYNKKNNRCGHTFQNRYKGIVVEDDRYLLSLVRYIHKNPLKAKICKKMQDYKYSSDNLYRTNNINGLGDIDFILSIFLDDYKNNPKKAIKLYSLFMDEEIEDLTKEEISLIEFQDKVDSKFKKELTINNKSIYIDIRRSLEQILMEVVDTKEQFDLIKIGSRKRYLTPYKFQYIKLAIKENYSFNDIGKFISVSDVAVLDLYRRLNNNEI